MSAPRLRRLQADYEKVTQVFSGHPYIAVTTEKGTPPEVYYITYHVPGLMLKGANPERVNRHQVVFQLTKNYPQIRPKCMIKTPIFHPNFRGGIVCVGDHWSAGGETLVDLIVKVGEMIQYKEYNLKSPMDAAAARWAQQNERLFPIGNLELYPREPRCEGKEQEEENWDIEFKAPGDEENDFDLIFQG